MDEEPLTKNIRGLTKLGNGLVAYLTKEARLLGWTEKDQLVIMTVKSKNKKEDKIIIKKLDV